MDNNISSCPTQASDDSDGSYKVGAVKSDIPDGFFEYALRFSLPHGAETWTNEKRFELAKLFNKKFNVRNYIWSFELKDDKETCYNPHLHAYIIAPRITSSTKSDWIKKNSKLIRPDALGRTLTNEQSELKKRKNYKAYIIKDGNYITNYTDEEMDEIIKLKEDIQESQKMRTEDKLLKIIQEQEKKLHEKYDLLTEEQKEMNTKIYEIGDLNDIYNRIIKIYCLEWKKAPPLSKCKDFSMYVGINMNNPHAMRPQSVFWE